MTIKPLLELKLKFVQNKTELDLNLQTLKFKQSFFSCSKSMSSNIGSFMTCSEFDTAVTNDTLSTVTFRNALKIKCNALEPQPFKNDSYPINREKYTRKITLEQIYYQFSKDPLSIYHLNLDSNDSINLVAIRTQNKKYRKHTNSMENQEFKRQLTRHKIINKNKQDQKILSFSNMLKIIQKNKNKPLSQQFKGQFQQNQNQDFNRFNSEFSFLKFSQNLNAQKQSSQIKIQNLQTVIYHQKNNQNKLELQQNMVFLGLQSNVSTFFHKNKKLRSEISQYFKQNQKYTKNRQQLSPICQNPQKRTLRKTDLNRKINTSKRKYQGLVEGLQFSKKLRKKTFKSKITEDQVSINEFQIER